MIELSLIQYIFSVIAGILVGFSLGLIGGGGSILAVPLLLYFVGLSSVPVQYQVNSSLEEQYMNFVDHLALGTTALAVGLNAYINSLIHLRKGNVNLKEGAIFTIPGVIGSFIGSYLSQITRGRVLLLLFGILMIIIALLMLRNQGIGKKVNVKGKLYKLISIGFLIGALSGYFGIGGGFLIVPGLIFSTGMDITKAVGTSLIAVGTFGISSSIIYAYYGYVYPIISILYLIGGIIGGYLGSSLELRLPKRILRLVFSIIVIIVAIYIILNNL